MNVKKVMLVPIVDGELDMTEAINVDEAGSMTAAQNMAQAFKRPIAAFGLHIIVQESGNAERG